VGPHGLFSWLLLTSFSLLPFFALHPAVSAISHGLGIRLWVTFAHQIKISSATTSLRIAWRWVLLRDPSGKRSPFALFCTDPSVAMLHIITWYVLRWNIEVTFQEARAHLGLCTQRHWSTPAIARTTPCLLGLFSLVVLMAHTLHPKHLPTRQTAWYSKAEPTFVDALAAVRRHLWAQLNSPTPPAPLRSANSSEAFLTTLIEVACYAA
jgi:hypothetical protein